MGRVVCAIVLVFSCLCATVFAAENVADDPLREMALDALRELDEVEAVPFERTDHPNAQWFPQAGFGLFMHWGIHSVAGIQPSWSMIKDYPYGTDKTEYHGKGYYTLLDKFDPQKYDPDAWIRAAAEAGMSYAVLTAKHHDGYALWPSEYGDMSTKQYLDGRDLLRPYIDACRKYGLKVGLYFSPRDWGYPGFPMSMVHQQPWVDPFNRSQEQLEEDFEAFYAYTVGQISELLTRYGKIDIIWFDGMGWTGNVDIRTEKTLAWVRRLQPHIIINPRWGGVGDYDTPEWNMPEETPDDWWENCISWSGHWGYSPDSPVQPVDWVIGKLVTARAWGGNFLLNIGPAPDGTMRPEYYERTAELARWMKHSKESLIGTEGVRNWKEFSTVPLTSRGRTWYLHLLPDTSASVEIRDVSRPKSVKLLRTNEPVAYAYENAALRIIIPGDLRKTVDDVIAVEWHTVPKH